MERREAIRARYQTFDGRISEYGLHPYHLLAYWYQTLPTAPFPALPDKDGLEII